MGEWISVKDRLPDTCQLVLCSVLDPDGNGGYDISYRFLKRVNSRLPPSWLCDRGIVTHWIPLPEPPQVNI